MTKQCTGDELIVFDDMPIGKSLSDYWRWNASDLLNNTAGFLLRVHRIGRAGR